MNLEILLAGGKTAFAPGETLTGIFRWQLDTAVNWIELRLIWYTEGKGSQDLGVGPVERVEHPAAHGQHPFALQAPNSPPSCSGRLVSVRWALDLITSAHLPENRIQAVVLALKLVTGGHHPVTRTELVIGPERQEILLGHVE